MQQTSRQKHVSRESIDPDRLTTRKRKREGTALSQSKHEDTVTITTKKKPDFSIPSTSSQLRNRIHSLLPELASANAELNVNDNIEDVDEKGAYIDMDLGLGVLEVAAAESSNESSDEDAVEATEVSEQKVDEDAMQRLMGVKHVRRKSMIQEILPNG